MAMFELLPTINKYLLGGRRTLMSDKICEVLGIPNPKRFVSATRVLPRMGLTERHWFVLRLIGTASSGARRGRVSQSRTPLGTILRENGLKQISEERRHSSHNITYPSKRVAYRAQLYRRVNTSDKRTTKPRDYEEL